MILVILLIGFLMTTTAETDSINYKRDQIVIKADSTSVSYDDMKDKLDSLMTTEKWERKAR